MKNVIIIHGKPSKENYYDRDGYVSSNFGWIPWLQNQLLTRDIMPNVPEMPHAYLPEYELWKRELERFDVTPETTLVAHSMGGGFLLRWLSENKDVAPARVILVAPSLDPLRKNETGFCEFEIDPTLTDRTQLVVMTSDNDSDKAEMSRKMITDALPSTDVRMFSGFGHFIPEHTGKDTLEELVDIILE
ncbi:MAG: putative alpha/beta hydrolase family esterase [Candidatus Paceibacteria bacterium]|jgi:predicted alpha/beta hydrolase family esterase